MKALLKKYKQTLKNLGFTLEKDQPKYAERQETNPLQISSIKDKKIIGVLENTGVVINPKNKEHREKYFSGVKPYKFLAEVVQNTKEFNGTLFEAIATNFVEEFTKSVKLLVKIYTADKIVELYNMKTQQLNDNGRRSYITTGVSCMQGKPRNFFKVYEETEGLQIAILEDNDGNMYGRALLWADNIEPSKRFNSNPKTKNLYYLDRIYIADTLCGSDKIKRVYQAQMYRAVCKALQLEKINCHSLNHFCSELTDKEADAPTHPPRPFMPRLKRDGLEFEQFPYADTFLGIDGDEWHEDDNGAEVGLTNTDGENSNDARYTCDSCGDRVHEDDINHCDHDDEHLCDECSIWSDYEDSYINRDYAVTHRRTDDVFHQDNI